jgi:hypothetical protein
MTQLSIISLGAGVQSTVMSLMAAKGELGPMPDCAIFADTQWEPAAIYEHLDWLETQLPFPVHRVTAGNIKEMVMAGLGTSGKRFASMPLFIKGAGMGQRGCTREYKIDPIKKEVRRQLGVAYRKRVPKGATVEQWIGISTDEAIRMKPSRDKWCDHRWPLIEAEMSRQHCLRWFEKHYPGRKLDKSSCIGCPFHNDAMWRDLKMNDPVSFAEAVEFDHAIRSGGGRFKGKLSEQYVHSSRMPLDEVDFRNLEDKGQLNMFNNECEGMCGV